jgi:hypothetical protein
VLRAFILAVRDEVRRDVRDAHRGIGGVDVLSALAAGAVGIDADVFGLDDDLDALVNFRRYVHAGKRRMAALGLIERRNAHQAVHADFALEKSEGVLAIDREGRRLQPRLFAGLVVVEHGFKPLALGPAQIHAQQHIRPVLGLSAAGSGMNGDDGVACVIFA